MCNLALNKIHKRFIIFISLSILPSHLKQPTATGSTTSIATGTVVGSQVFSYIKIKRSSLKPVPSFDLKNQHNSQLLSLISLGFLSSQGFLLRVIVYNNNNIFLQCCRLIIFVEHSFRILAVQQVSEGHGFSVQGKLASSFLLDFL